MFSFAMDIIFRPSLEACSHKEDLIRDQGKMLKISDFSRTNNHVFSYVGFLMVVILIIEKHIQSSLQFQIRKALLSMSKNQKKKLLPAVWPRGMAVIYTFTYSNKFLFSTSYMSICIDNKQKIINPMESAMVAVNRVLVTLVQWKESWSLGQIRSKFQLCQL